jgi:hypothetical protein
MSSAEAFEKEKVIEKVIYELDSMTTENHELLYCTNNSTRGCKQLSGQLLELAKQ